MPTVLGGLSLGRLSFGMILFTALMTLDGKSCLHFKQLADLDKSVLEQLVAGSIAEVRRRYR